MPDTRLPGKPRARADLAAGREALARRAWDDAWRSFAAADAAVPLDVEDLDQWVWSAGLTGRDDDFISIQERIYRARLDAGETRRAARAAFWLGLRLFSLGETGRATGWLSRSDHLIAGKDCAERGYLLLPAIYRDIAAGDFDGACSAAIQAAGIGKRFDEPDLAAFAGCLHGRALLRGGQPAAGLALLDEVMLAVTGGGVSPLITGLIYCSVIASCQEVFALDRCREWTSALAAWCDEQPQMVTFTGACLVHRAEVMQLNGAWTDAISEARQATRRFAVATDPEAVAGAFYQQAEIHRLRGEYREAEDAYRRSSAAGGDIQPGYSLLRLAQGRGDAAASGIRRAVGAATSQARRMRLLPACIEIMLATGAVDEADAASREIAGIALTCDMDIVSAMADHARGAVLLARGDPQAALAPLRDAFVAWHHFGAPYLAARLRVLLGTACLALGDDDGAGLEFDAARSVFSELGAAPDLARVAAVAKPSALARPDGLTPREVEVLRLVATGKTNKAIASELALSERTVDRHLSNIFTKIDVSSRAAATAYAFQHKLV
ncbi:helix-turn-helix transcriptional regulator [Bauldia litoralis]|uniref:Transcriptional regulator, LuxR family n=1 Tax=Bauldia litoralis TaxID=665467 RepID=A0A1G6CXV7_9HYPH|nr:helix-turn-helix transcriptional regulator [Bauldia litoralis]SDB37668.1 transcriptional regulator, LuxR family [Bauldia litoralis]